MEAFSRTGVLSLHGTGRPLFLGPIVDDGAPPRLTQARAEVCFECLVIDSR